ncbi:hypothetical protein GPL20_05220 [Bradyrhizobium cajani]|uniref:Uncharacterized protein n=1 Tax=Bradyrhizobium cajani TaxID=1928661 RepID=A0A844TCY3_9BRAD|nr:hypothetical protein [Bradyrhizobium cajani]
MMPMRIRRKSQPIEKLENPTALQRRGRSFPRDHANQFTLASTRGGVAPRIREARSAIAHAIGFRTPKLPHRHAGHPRPSCRLARHEWRALRLAEAASAAQAGQARP